MDQVRQTLQVRRQELQQLENEGAWRLARHVRRQVKRLERQLAGG